MNKRTLCISAILLASLLLCGDAAAFTEGGVAYIKKGSWWTFSVVMLERVNEAIKAKDYAYLAYLENRAVLNIQRVRIKVVVIMETQNMVKVRIFGTPATLWIWGDFLVKR